MPTLLFDGELGDEVLEHVDAIVEARHGNELANRVKLQATRREVRAGEATIGELGTVRAAAARYGVSKSTVHKDLTQRLPDYDPALYREVKALLDRNKAERHLRGGAATRKKYKGE